MANEPIDEKAVFNSARCSASPEERAAYLQQACGHDPDALGRILDLLRVYDQEKSFLESSPVAPLVATVDEPIAREGPGTVIGPYKLLEQIGEGGFGVVFMAEQTQPVRRKVALKVLKPGMDTRQVVARFEAERQALAIMDHPNIAKVFDGGTTGEKDEGGRMKDEKEADGRSDSSFRLHRSSFGGGRPYFVMELVKGVPITEFCDQNHLTPRQRLELFVPVCQAVQHAHHKGIIHRDLKPSNVLVTVHDTTPVPKVIDFGVAKALGQELTDKSLFTGFAQMIGTPLYMSPEQAGQSGLDIDTRSDIYSLGVLLYELLTGTTPFDKERFKQAAYDEIRRIIREEEPPKPSTRLSESKDSLPSISAQRQTEPAKLTKLVRGELDWIVMKTLEKDRNRRYETANGFAMDVQRYLADQPVLACPPSAGYRLRKFARRNKRTLVTAALLGVMLLAAVGAVAGSLGWAARDRAARRAEAAQQASASLIRARAWMGDNKLALARQELAEAKGRIGNDRAALPALAEEIEALDAALARFQSFLDLVEQAHEAETRLTVELALSGEADRGMKSAPSPVRISDRDPAKAVPFLLQALSRYEVMERDDWPAALERGLVETGQVRQIRRSAYEELLWLADDVFRRRQEHHSGRKLSPAEAAREGLVYLHKAEASWRPTAAFFRIRAGCRKASGEAEAARADEALVRQTPPTIALDHYLLGVAAQAARDKAEGVKQFEAALRLEPTHYWSLMSLGSCLDDLGDQEQDFAAATVAFTGCILKRPEHAPAWHNRGVAHGRLRQYDRSLADFSKAIELKPDAAWSWTNRGVSHANLRQYDKALADHSKAIELQPDYALAWNNRGDCHRNLRQYAKALADCSKAIELKPGYAPAWNNRGNAHADLGQHDKAMTDYSKATELQPDEALAWYNRGTVHADLGQYDKAIADLSKAIEIKPDLKEAWFNRGDAYRNLHQYDKALADLSKVIQLKPDDAKAWNNRGVIHKDLGQYDKAIADYSKAIELKPDYAWAWDNRGNAHQGLGQYAKAVADHSKAIEIEPDLPEAWSNRGNAHSNLRQYDKALADYSKAIELKPDYQQAWYNRGGVYLRLGQYDKALADCSRAIELKADFAEAWDNRGSAHQGLGQHAKAVADHSKAIEIKPDLAGAWSNRGNAHTRLGQYNKALSDCSKAIELKPDLAGAWSNRGDGYLMLGQYDKALVDYSKAIELKADLALAWNGRGIAHVRLRQNDKALADFSKAIELKADLAVAWNNRGDAYLMLGQYDKALGDFSKAIELKADFTAAWGNRGNAHGHLRQYGKALADYEKSLELAPANPSVSNNLAWLLATCPDSAFRDPARAVKLGKKAIALAPQSGTYWNTLGVAHHRAGEWKAAINALNKSMELSQGGDPNDWLFLAMAHAKLGTKDEARTWYDRAVQWMEKNAPRNEDLRRFRAEAAKLLGVKEK